MSLPELHGWMPAAVLARREQVTPSTIRRRAARGAYDVIPNPLGPGALYREKSPSGPAPRPEGGSAGQTPIQLHHGAVRGLVRDDRYVLALLPGTAPQIARAAGLSRGGVYRRLRRLERWSFLRCGEAVPPGRRGGRPSYVWTVA